MSKEKLAKLNKFAAVLKDRLSSPVPEKHKGHPESFRLMLNRELETVNKQIAEAKLEGMDKK